MSLLKIVLRRPLLSGMCLSIPLGLMVLAGFVLVMYPGDVGPLIGRIKPGMTVLEVTAELGPPQETVTYQNGHRRLVYPSGFHDPYVIVVDEADRVVGIW